LVCPITTGEKRNFCESGIEEGHNRGTTYPA
jgi:hypothetical protein